MESNNKLKEIDIKNCTYYYFDNIIRFEDFDLDNISVDEKLHEIVLGYNISCKTLIGAKSLPIKFNEIDRFIRDYDGTRYLVFFGAESKNQSCLI